jgi:hypothetical protein
MRRQQIVFGKVGDKEARDQQPMGDADERVPHPDLTLRFVGHEPDPQFLKYRNRTVAASAPDSGECT